MMFIYIISCTYIYIYIYTLFISITIVMIIKFIRKNNMIKLSFIKKLLLCDMAICCCCHPRRNLRWSPSVW